MSEDDILRAIGKLKALGSGFQVVKIGSQKLVRSVPGELNTDKSVLLELAQGRGYVSEAQLEQVRKTLQILNAKARLPAEFHGCLKHQGTILISMLVSASDTLLDILPRKGQKSGAEVHPYSINFCSLVVFGYRRKPELLFCAGLEVEPYKAARNTAGNAQGGVRHD